MSPAPDDRLITITRAILLAKERGVDVQRNTVLKAAIRGDIAEASQHDGSLWRFPAWAFDDWLAVHAARKPYGSRTAESKGSS